MDGVLFDGLLFNPLPTSGGYRSSLHDVHWFRPWGTPLLYQSLSNLDVGQCGMAGRDWIHGGLAVDRTHNSLASRTTSH